MISTVINPKGVTQGRFSRVEEYVVFCFAPNAFVADSEDNLLNPPVLNRKPRWKGLLRSGTDALRSDRESMFYPIFIDDEHHIVKGAGSYLPISETPTIGEKIDGLDVAWPIRKDGSFGRWSVGSETLNALISKGYVSCGRFDAKRNTWGITYISQPNQAKIEQGKIIITGRDEQTGVVSIEYAQDDTRVIKTIWHRSYHDAGAYGSDLITSILGYSGAFSFPKSVYSTKDALSAIVRNNPNALIVDFFAGSGTTLNAVNLLNAEDGGQRRCIIVTNNEVSESESEELKTLGYTQGDAEWEMHGICRSVTWPRTKYTITGKRADDSVLGGEYFSSLTHEVASARIVRKIDFVTLDMLSTAAKKKQIVALLGKDKLAQSLVKVDSKYIVSDKHSVSILFDDSAIYEWLDALDEQDHIREFYIITQNSRLFNDTKGKIQELLGDYIVQEQVKRPISDGFSTNCEYFKLGFLDKNDVALGRQFKEILPLLWLKAGAVGKRPEYDGELPDMLILPENRLAILINESGYMSFAEQLNEHPEIDSVFIVTDSERAYREMISGLKVTNTYQLYRSYLDNFRINARR